MSFCIGQTSQINSGEAWLQKKILHAILQLNTECSPLSMQKDKAHYKITLRPKKNVEAVLGSLWTFTLHSELQILVEMTDQHQSFLQPSPTVSVEETLAQFNRQSFLGMYFVNPRTANLLCFRYSIPLSVLRNYVSGTISEIFWQVSEQFTKYALKLQLIGGNQDIKSSKVHVALIKLRHMKEQLEMNRLERTKAIKYYDLSNCSVKIVDDALKIIGYQTGLLLNFKTNGNGKMNPKKIDRCKKVSDTTYEQLKVIQGQMRASTQLSEIVQGIEISKIISEKKIDEGGYSLIFKGEYIANFYPTINPNLLKSSKNKVMKETVSLNKMMVRKTLKSQQENDLSFQNQLNFLRFIRNEKHPRISGYFFPTYARSKEEEQEKDPKHIFLEYYKNNLLEASKNWSNVEQRLKACKQIFEGIRFLGEKSILHRDLKELNILVDSKNDLKMIDFGSSCGIFAQQPTPGSYSAIENELMSTKNYYFPFNFLASQYPIIAKDYSRDQYNRAQTFDVFSVGSIINNMFYMDFQYFDTMVHNQLNYLVSKCHERNPADRPTAKESECYIYLIIQLSKALGAIEISTVVRSPSPESELLLPLPEFRLKK